MSERMNIKLGEWVTFVEKEHLNSSTQCLVGYVLSYYKDSSEYKICDITNKLYIIPKRFIISKTSKYKRVLDLRLFKGVVDRGSVAGYMSQKGCVSLCREALTKAYPIFFMDQFLPNPTEGVKQLLYYLTGGQSMVACEEPYCDFIDTVDRILPELVCPYCGRQFTIELSETVAQNIRYKVVSM